MGWIISGGERNWAQPKLTGLPAPSTGHNDINKLFDALKSLRCKKYCTVFWDYNFAEGYRNYDGLFISKYRPGSLMRYFFEDGAGFDYMRVTDELKQGQVGLMIAVGV